jgi:iron-sulfur cluster assembly accessory protein
MVNVDHGDKGDVSFGIQISDLAAEKILSQTQSLDTCLRVRVKSGGCAGMQYVFTFVSQDQVQKEDVTFMHKQACVVIDPLSLHFLAGGTLDYRQELMAESFVFVNPKAQNSCGCGESFSI